MELTLQLLFKLEIFSPSEVMLLQHKHMGLMWAGKQPLHHLIMWVMLSG